MSLESATGARSSANPMLQPNPADVLVSAINERLLESADSLKRRETLKRVSAQLRTAFGFDPDELPPLPIQLGQNHSKACAYVQSCVTVWLQSDNLDRLFEWLGLDEATTAGVRDLLWRAVEVEPVASWMCREFGGLRTSRQARHARRYLAIKLAGQLAATAVEAEDAGSDSEAPRQSLLDKWTDLDCPASESLYYQKVVKVYCNLLLGLEFDYQSNVVGLRGAADDVQASGRGARKREFIDTPRQDTGQVPLEVVLSHHVRSTA